MKECFRSICIVLTMCNLVSCSIREDDIFNNTSDVRPSGEVFGEGLEEDALLHEMNIYVEPETAEALEKATGENGFVKMSEVPSLAVQGVVRMRRLFPDAGEFEERTREAGLHRWYVLSYDEMRPMTRAAEGLDLPGVIEVEYCPRIEIIGNPEVVEYVSESSVSEASVPETSVSEASVPETSVPETPVPEVQVSGKYASAATKIGSSEPFNDPMLSQQWHYYNNGSASSSVSGCDINVYPVWRNYSTYAKYTGDIIVGVVDGGIDYTHEDLKDNMWHNPEKSGENVYGYNFVNNSFNIHAEEHGTHVAGTIAAVNNNGKGVCGVSGGDSGSGIKGAKLMSCQIFDGDNQGSGAEAIKWSADHGAVISQNSWGYTELTTTPASLKSAVDYFIANAGVDKNGNQTGPMRGGIVIFAAGNDNKMVSGNDYEKILNVSAVGADYKRAYYTNYGQWCDVSAPGGDAKKGNQVLSTLPGNKYGKMQGTSMACPHVSGVAALVLARYGGSGYTCDALRKRIEDNLTDISSQNPSYYLGKGLVNAYKAIAGSGGKAPSVPTGLEADAESNNISFSVAVPSDSDDGKPTSIYIYYSTADFTSAKDAMFGVFYVEDIPVGGKLSGIITGVEFETGYYVAAQACDLAGNKSALTKRVQVTTGGNRAPELIAKTALEFTLKPHESAAAEFDIIEPDGHYYSIDLEPGSKAAVLDTLVRESPKIRISAAAATAGKYSAKLTVTDYYGLSTSATVKYEVLENHKPEIVKPIDDMVFSSTGSGMVQLAAEDYFTDADGEELSYSFTFSNLNVANMTYSKGKFLITPMNYGVSEVTVTGRDIRGESVSLSFRILVADTSKMVVCYPNPVKDRLNIRVNREYGNISVKIVSSAGSIFLERDLGAADPFEPSSVNMSSAAPGSYTVIVTLDGNTNKIRIVKI